MSRAIYHISKSITGGKEFISKFTPLGGVRYEVLTIVMRDGFVKSTAHKYKKDYRERVYVGDQIDISRRKHSTVKAMRKQHLKAYETIKKYHKNKQND